MRIFTENATLKSLEKYDSYLLVYRDEHERISQAEAAELVREAVLIHSPGEILKQQGYLLMLQMKHDLIFIKKDEQEDEKKI